MTRYIATRSPVWNLFNELMHGSESLGSSDYSVSGHWPSIRVSMNDDALLVEAELAGISPDDVSVEIEGSTLVISGEMKCERNEKDREILTERFEGRFERRVSLPFKVAPKSVNANFKDGLLTVTLPKAEEERVQRISIKAA
jgi:HSP20 family protein